MSIQIYRRCMVKASDLLPRIDLAYAEVDPRVCMLKERKGKELYLSV